MSNAITNSLLATFEILKSSMTDESLPDGFQNPKREFQNDENQILNHQLNWRRLVVTME